MYKIILPSLLHTNFRGFLFSVPVPQITVFHSQYTCYDTSDHYRAPRTLPGFSATSICNFTIIWKRGFFLKTTHFLLPDKGDVLSGMQALWWLCPVKHTDNVDSNYLCLLEAQKTCILDKMHALPYIKLHVSYFCYLRSPKRTF